MFLFTPSPEFGKQKPGDSISPLKVSFPPLSSLSLNRKDYLIQNDHAALLSLLAGFLLDYLTTKILPVDCTPFLKFEL